MTARRATRRFVPWASVIALMLATACRQTPVEVRLAQQFAGAYAESATPTGQTKSFELVAEEAELPLVDGAALKVWAYNRQVPGPTLRVRVGDRVQVKLTNHLPQATTIHWHGVRLPNAMDGVPHLTQPPIEPGQSFTYEFTPKDAGTFWFHPHLRSSEQVERGLYGALVVEDAKPPPYTQDVVWVLHDWLLDEGRQILGQFNTPHDLMHDGRWGNAVTVNGRTDTVLKVANGDRVRLRIINASNGRSYAPDLRGLDAKLIAVDGLYARHPQLVERVEIAPGNRVDLDLSFEGGQSRLFSIEDRFYDRFTNHLATIAVEGSAARPATPFPSPARAAVPTWAEGLATPVAKDFALNARRGGEYGIEWTIDNAAFSGHEHAKAALTLKRGQWAHLRFSNASARLHPMHLHGMFFKVLGRNGAPVDEPFFRDTALIRGRETLDIGLVPLDVGRWMMHCHILEHAEAGMMTTIDVVD